MEPTISAGQTLQVDRLAYLFRAPKRWDVVLFRPPESYKGIWAFRVVGLPGENINFEAGRILVNGEKIEVPLSLSKLEFSTEPAYVNAKHTYPVLVPDDSYFLLGDNPEIARDSRVIGSITRAQIIGKLKSATKDGR